jgi:hypothetical protein
MSGGKTVRSARIAVAALAALAAVLLAAPTALATPPAILASGVTDVQGISATLTGEVDPGGLATSYRFEYVSQANFEADQPNGFARALATPAAPLAAVSGERPVTAAIVGLTPDTSYRFRIRAENSDGVNFGGEASFSTFHGFGFQPGAAGFDVAIEGEGKPQTQAGSHPQAIVTSIDFNRAGERAGQPGVPVTDGDARDVQIELPPGLIENPGAVDKCTQDDFHTPRGSPFEASASGESCPAVSQIGVVTLRSSAEGAGHESRSFGLFNLVPPPGFPSQIGFSPFGVPIAFTPHIRDLGGEYGTTLDLRNLSQRVDVYGMTIAIWGTPWGVSHNGQRGACLDELEPGFPWAKCPVEPGGRSHFPFAYLTLPASCTGPIAFTATATSWQQPFLATGTALSRDASGAAAGLTGCDTLRFEPVVTARPTNPRASSPSGFDFTLTPKEEALTNPKARVPSQARRAVVTLPEGVTVNPSLAAGLGSCTPQQYAEETAASPLSVGCPENSKIGTFTVQSPLFEETVGGAIYLAEPDDRDTPTPGAENPFDSLLAVYLVARNAARGVLVRVPGRLAPDPVTGRLTATFDELPQLPYSNLKLHFREGQRAPLVTPSACGTFATQVALTPWNDPNATALSAPQFAIAKGIGPGEACPTGATPPFAPGASGGTLNGNAGSFTPFYLHLTRSDAEQEFTSYSATLPPGLTGKIAGIPYCPDAAIEAAKRKTGREEERHPSCPAVSQIGRTVSGYGASQVLAYAPGRLYLAGPYHGSAFSVVAIDSATVGPFDLGVVVVRSAIRVDPRTAQITIDSGGSDPIPHILEGVPIHLRDVRVYIDRPEGTLNPTGCDAKTLTSTMTGSGGATANVPTRFQVSNCSALKFRPQLSLRLRGKTRRGAFPSLRASLRPHRGDANIGSAAVTLPPSLFLAQDHIDTVCSQRQFAADNCPAGSVYGQATAITPLLSRPLRGKVYLRSSQNQLPDLVVALRGNGIAIDLVGRIDSFRGGIRTSFDVVPDAPVTKFVLSLRGGKRSLLVNAENVCRVPQRALARFVGQDNAGEATHPLMRAGCGKGGKR